MAEAKVYKLEDLKKNNTEKSCWLAVNGKVYDVTTFLEEHPGGYDIILSSTGAAVVLPSCMTGSEKSMGAPEVGCNPWCFDVLMQHPGKDATQDFEEVGHSNSAKKLLEKYLIGTYEVRPA
jgi:cytochrome b involved in lipid metabolism